MIARLFSFFILFLVDLCSFSRTDVAYSKNGKIDRDCDKYNYRISQKSDAVEGGIGANKMRLPTLAESRAKVLSAGGFNSYVGLHQKIKTEGTKWVMFLAENLKTAAKCEHRI